MRGDISNVYFPFIEIKLKDGTSLSWNKGAPDYFTSLSHTRYVERANTATINITVAIGPNDDPDKIEKVIVESGGECLFQYGFAGRKSRAYRGVIIGYTPNFSEGVISYSLNIISRSVIFNGAKITGLKYELTEEEKDIVNEDKEESTTRSLFDESLLKKTWASFKILAIMAKIVEVYMPGYVFDIDNSDLDFSIPTFDMDFEGLSPVIALQNIADKLYHRGSSVEKSAYTYKIIVDDNISDNGVEGTVKIKRQGCIAKFISSEDDSKKTIVLSYEFLWGSKNCDVISWSPRYQGSALIFKDARDRAEVTSTVQIDNNSNVEFTAYVPPPAVEEVDTQDRWTGNWNDSETYQNILSDTAWYCEQCNYPYKAEIVVLGLPDDDVNLLSTYVSVVPMVSGGKAHHSKGIYQVIGITDNVDSSGFTTKLTLVKAVEESNMYIADENQCIYDKDGNKVSIYDYTPNHTKGTLPETSTIMTASAFLSTGTTFAVSGQYTNAKIVWNALVSAGYNDIICAGIMGNLMVESGGGTLNIDPTAHNTSGENSWGIAQWNIAGGDYQREIYGNADINAQAAFLVKTIPGHTLQKYYTQMMNSRSPEEAALAFKNGYEISRDDGTGRMRCAREAYEYFSGLAQNKNLPISNYL